MALSFLLIRLPTPTHPLRVSVPAADAGGQCSTSQPPRRSGAATFAAWLASLGFSSGQCLRRQSGACASGPSLLSRARNLSDPGSFVSRRNHKSLINAVNFYPRRHLLEVWSLPSSTYQRKAHSTAETKQRKLLEAFFLFGMAHPLRAELLRLGAARNHTTIIVRRYDNRAPSQIWMQIRFHNWRKRR
ncbi:hypothetical protein KCP71_20565 [Salmonella enterica subsp. enterica]|nr:hypothetical protein KCP71_20565 [Salmonella enterica subsp. enterica]